MNSCAFFRTFVSWFGLVNQSVIKLIHVVLQYMLF